MTNDSEALAIKPRRGTGFDVVGLGEISLDIVGVGEDIPAPGQKAALSDLRERPGGTVATALLGCRRLGLTASLYGAVGDDPFGAAALEPLQACGVDVSHVRQHADTATRRALILVDERTGDRRVFGHRDAGLARMPRDVAPEPIRAARLLLTDTSDPTAAETAARIARDAGTAVVLDADEVWPSPARLLDQVQFPVVSETLAQQLGRNGSVDDGLKFLEAAGAVIAVATQGERGATARYAGRSLRCPAFPVSVVDSTGAGDAFRAGFIWALLKGEHKVSAILRLASAVAALNCLGQGAQGGLPNAAQVEHFLARY